MTYKKFNACATTPSILHKPRQEINNIELLLYYNQGIIIMLYYVWLYVESNGTLWTEVSKWKLFWLNQPSGLKGSIKSVSFTLPCPSLIDEYIIKV